MGGVGHWQSAFLGMLAHEPQPSNTAWRMDVRVFRRALVDDY